MSHLNHGRTAARLVALAVLAIAACSAALTGSLAVWALAAMAAVGVAYLSADGLVSHVKGQPLHGKGRRPER